MDNTKDLINKISDFGTLIAEKNRLKILNLLKDKELPASQINRQLRLPQNLSSHHLIVLKKTGLLKSRQQGRFIYYSLNQKNLKSVISDLKVFLS